MDLVQDGVLVLPLYHGTSSVNALSIHKNGLGARNPVEELQVVPFLRDLYEVACAVIPDEDSDWPVVRVMVDPIVRQMITGGGFNFRHGGSYLTPARSSAIRYAMWNRDGSEIITTTKQVFQLVRRYSPQDAERIASRNPELVRRLEVTGTPVLIRVERIPVAQLKSEDGTDAVSSIQDIQQLLRSSSLREADAIEVLCQQTNFELVGVIPSKELLFWKFVDDCKEWQIMSDTDFAPARDQIADSDMG